MKGATHIMKMNHIIQKMNHKSQAIDSAPIESIMRVW